jgi:hypothetical protein
VQLRLSSFSFLLKYIKRSGRPAVVDRVADEFIYVYVRVRVCGWRDSIKQTFNKPTERTSINPPGSKSGCTFPCLHHGNRSSFSFRLFHFCLFSIPYSPLISCRPNTSTSLCAPLMPNVFPIYWSTSLLCVMGWYIWEREREIRRGGLDSRLTCFIQSGC